MVPCPICGKCVRLDIAETGKTFPSFGSTKRQELCNALGVPSYLFENIQTRRKMCLSHFDEDSFYMYRGRYTLKRDALPRRLSEIEKFILLNSDFNKDRIRQPKVAHIPDFTEEFYPNPDDDQPNSSQANNGVTGSANGKKAKSTSIGKRVGKAVVKKSPKIQTIPDLSSVRNTSQAPENSLHSSSQEFADYDFHGEKAIKNDYDGKVRKANRKRPRELMTPDGQVLQVIYVPPGTRILVNSYVPTMAATNDYSMLQNGTTNVQTSSISSAFNEQRVIKKEEPDSDIEVLPPPPVKDLPPTSIADNDSEIVKTDQEANGISSNTNLILARCLQYTESLPDVQPKNDVTVKSEIMSNVNESISRNVQNGYRKRYKI